MITLSRQTEALYIVLCVVGAALPLAQFLPWLAANGLNVGLLVEQLFSNRISSFFGWDVLVSAVVLLLTLVLNREALSPTQRLAVTLGTCLVGVSLGLPLFFLFRERNRRLGA